MANSGGGQIVAGPTHLITALEKTKWVRRILTGSPDQINEFFDLISTDNIADNYRNIQIQPFGIPLVDDETGEYNCILVISYEEKVSKRA